MFHFDILKKYAEVFNLVSIDCGICIELYDDRRLVGKLDKSSPRFFSYKEGDKWQLCKTTDLVSLILNDCALHVGDENVL